MHQAPARKFAKTSEKKYSQTQLPLMKNFISIKLCYLIELRQQIYKKKPPCTKCTGDKKNWERLTFLN